MKLAIILVHNKSDQENFDQIEALKSLLTKVVDGPFTNPDTGEAWTTIHHEIIGLGFPHEVKVYQVIPFDVTPPVNRYEVNSGGIVQYGKGDEDKKGDHPRFFNWGLKRATDYGAEIVLHIDDVSKLNIPQLKTKLQNKPDFSEEQFGKIGSLKLLKEKGLLDESKTVVKGIEKYKEVKNG